jgi:Leucine-rich repeat (LRR) protein
MDDEIKKEEEIDEENIIEDYIDLNSGGYEQMQKEIGIMDKEIDKIDYLLKIYDLSRVKINSIIVLNLFNKAKTIVDDNFCEYLKNHAQERQIKQAGLHYFFAIYLMILFGLPKDLEPAGVKEKLKELVVEKNNIKDLFHTLDNFDFYLGSCGIEAQNLAINK